MSRRTVGFEREKENGSRKGREENEKRDGGRSIEKQGHENGGEKQRAASGNEWGESSFNSQVSERELTRGQKRVGKEVLKR